MKVGRFVRVLSLAFLLGTSSLAPGVRGEEPVETRAGSPRSEQRPANIPFLFSAYALTWAAIWIYILVIHGRQRRVEKMLDRLEKSGEATGRGRG